MRIIRRLREGIRETLGDEVQTRAAELPCGCLFFFIVLTAMIVTAPLLLRHRGNVLRVLLDLLGF